MPYRSKSNAQKTLNTVARFTTLAERAAKKNRNGDTSKINEFLLLGQESERGRIAREFHDDISQRLALVCLALDQIEPALQRYSPDLSTELKAVRHQVDAIASDVHRLSHNLHPSTVNLGLTIALRRLCRDFSDQRKIAVLFTDNGSSPRMPEDVALALFRVTQECLTNVAKHSGSRQARVSLVERKSELLLTIADTGVGFDIARTATHAGLGLVSIRERARLIGATVNVESGRSLGTVVRIRLPMRRWQSG